MNDHQPSPKPTRDFDDLYRDARNHRPTLTWNYAAKGWLRRAETSVLYGPSNCGKSALVGYLGNCIITGTPFFGAKVKKGFVVHVGAEAPEAVLDRMQAFDLSEATDASPYIVRMEPVDLSIPEEVKQFVSDIKKLHQRIGQKSILIVFDTLARSIGMTDENCAASMTRVANAAEQIARKLKSHVMLVHHTGKDVDRGGRGSSALRGAVDTEISLVPLKSGEVMVTQEKQRTMPKSASQFFRTEGYVLGLDEDGDDRTTVKAVEAKQPENSDSGKKRDTAGKYDTAVLTALHIRRMTGKHAVEPFRPREIMESVPPELFGAMSDDNRLASIRRVLAKLADQKNPIIEKLGEAWRLILRGDSATPQRK
jgi:energy-coupling factor transporter ATP-binding protein EcfA2